MAKRVRRKALGALTPGYRLASDLENLLDRLLPLDAHEVARGKLHVSLTDVKTKLNHVVSDFDSRQELIEVGCGPGLTDVMSASSSSWDMSIDRITHVMSPLTASMSCH